MLRDYRKIIEEINLHSFLALFLNTTEFDEELCGQFSSER